MSNLISVAAAKRAPKCITVANKSSQKLLLYQKLVIYTKWRVTKFSTTELHFTLNKQWVFIDYK